MATSLPFAPHESNVDTAPPAVLVIGGAGAQTVLCGRRFVTCDVHGDIDAHDAGDRAADGLFAHDTRVLSRWHLAIDGFVPQPLGPPRGTHARRRFTQRSRTETAPTWDAVIVERELVVDTSMHERVVLENPSHRAATMLLTIDAATDFADVFAVKDIVFGAHGDDTGEVGPEGTSLAADQALQLAVEVTGAEPGEPTATSVGARVPGASVQVTASIPFHLDQVGDAAAGTRRARLAWKVDLAPRERWTLDLEVTWRVAGPTHDDDAVAPAAGGATSEFEAAARRSDARARAWHDDLPELRNAPADVALALRTGVDDLGALQVDALVGGVTEQVPAAGLPWFMATFGRDTLITCLQGMALGAHRVAPALRLLAELQATTDDPHVDAEPGKVLHELRDGAIAEGGFGTYYGSIDSTPLWLVTLDEYHRWTGDDDLVRELEPAARAALRWIAEHGDSDGDGLIDWLRRSEHGLQNQSWKDSHDSQRFTDGSFATGAIAPLEAQGYAVDAQLRAARLARDVWNDPDFAQALEARAEALRDRIDAAFWVTGIEDSTVRRSRGSTGLLGGVVGASGGNVDVEADDPRAGGWYALAVDGDGRKVDALASNIGHLLWSGAARPERVPRTVAQLVHPALATGWGVRTMSTLDAAYHPLSYHCGTVWPHDTSLCIAGLARAGAGEQAAQLARGLFAAAAQLDGRLPEVLSGLERDRTGAPVPYPTTCSPQAWAAAAPVFVLTELLGLAPDPDAGVLAVRPGTRAPEWLHGVEWRGIPAQGGLWNVVVDDAGVVNVQPAGRPDPRR